MNQKSASTIHWSFWLISIVTLIWNVMGCMNYIMQMNPDSLAAFPETHRAIIEGRPAWASAGFAVGVFSGALGCLLLLFRKTIAVPVFIASLLGVVVTMIHTLDVVSTTAGFGFFEMSMMLLMPLLVAAFLTWYSRRAMNKGWIR